MTTPTWHPHPRITDYQVDVLADDEAFARGDYIASVEDFGYACYATALNAATGNVERGGPHSDRAAAYAWAERVAGLHPVKPTDERPPFYYAAGEGRA